MPVFFKYLKGCHTEGQDLFSIIPECGTQNMVFNYMEADLVWMLWGGDF